MRDRLSAPRPPHWTQRSRGAGTECGLWGCLRLLSRARPVAPGMRLESGFGHHDREDRWKEEQPELGWETGLWSTWPPHSFQSISFRSGKSALATSPCQRLRHKHWPPPDGPGNTAASRPSMLSSPRWLLRPLSTQGGPAQREGPGARRGHSRAGPTWGPSPCPPAGMPPMSCL